MQAEKAIEQYLCRSVKDAGGFCVKMTNMNGIPDRAVLLPGGKFALVELKAPGGRVSAIQEVRHKQLKAMGYKVYILWNFEQVDKFINEFMKGEKNAITRVSERRNSVN